jgi:hypothetical protein
MKRTALALVVSTGLATSFASVTTPASAQEWAGGQRAESRRVLPNRYFLGAGAAIIVAAYVPGVVIAATSDREGDNRLYIPILGPWLDLGERDPCRDPSCNRFNTELYTGLLITSGAAQLVGLGAMIASLAVPGYQSERPSRQRAEIHLSPMQLTRTGYGLGVSGQF